MKKRIVCAMLAAMMVFSTATPTLAAVTGTTSTSGGSITVDTEKKEPIYKVSVPTSQKFYIDPFEQLGAAQITSEDFAFINKSNVAVAIETKLVLTAGSGVTLKTKASDVTETDTSKLAYIEAEIPKVVEETAATAASYVDSSDFATSLPLYKGGSANGYYKTSDTSGNAGETQVAPEMIDTTKAKGKYDNSHKVALDTTATGTTLTFVLDKADYVDYYTNYNDTDTAGSVFKSVAADQKGSAVFRFSGKVNTLAAWVDADLSVAATYTFNGLTSEHYAEKIADGVEDAHAYTLTGTEATFTAGSNVGEITYTEGSGEKKLKEIVKIEMQYTDGSMFDGYNAIESLWEAATKEATKITLAPECMAFWAEQGTVDAVVTYKNEAGNTKTVTVKDVVTSK